MSKSRAFRRGGGRGGITVTVTSTAVSESILLPCWTCTATVPQVCRKCAWQSTSSFGNKQNGDMFNINYVEQDANPMTRFSPLAGRCL